VVSACLALPVRVLPRFHGHLVTAHIGARRGVMGLQRRKFSAEYKREAVAMLDAPAERVNEFGTLAVGI